jgi:hypothetical protein
VLCGVIIMKELNVKIEKCNNCPYFDKDKRLYAFICKLTNQLITVDKNNSIQIVEIPEWCGLNNAT